MKQPSETPAKKKPYQSPKLLVYGDLTEMTKVTKKAGRPDGASSGPNRRTGG
jgi:hypothetical protein